MLNRSIKQRVSKWMAVAALLGFGLAMAQSSEPTLNQVYEAAQAGRLEQAQQMVQQVLVAHPNSAKAYFVQAELSARQGQLGRAREALGTAEKLAPNLPFAKPEAVQALRVQLAAKNSPAVAGNPVARALGAGAPSAPAAAFPWGMAMMLGAGVIALGIFFLRKKPTPALVPQPAYANQSGIQGGTQGGLNGPQSFGAGGTGMAPAYGQPAGGGLGGKLMGGLATGLAVGAGVMAAQAIGKSLMGNDEKPAHQNDNAAGNDYQPIAGNNDLGGQNFGVNDAGSWDEGNSIASSGDGGGGDWDS